jgi:hypothetical protein
VADTGGIKVFAGPRDDPFYFDLTGFKNFVAGPFVPASGLRPDGEEPADFFAGSNISAIVMELPISALTGEETSDTGIIRAWATTSRGSSQVDRMAIPAINTALIPSDQKDAFNQADPVNDESDFRPTAQTTIETLRGAVDGVIGSPQDGGPLGDLTPEQVATALIPDVVTIDFSQPVAFPNGRQLGDDVIDVALGVVLNRGGAAGIPDAINGNDKAFESEFPYLAAPHAADAEPDPTASVVPQAPPAAGSGGRGDGDSTAAWFLLASIGAASIAAMGAGLALRRAKN